MLLKKGGQTIASSKQPETPVAIKLIEAVGCRLAAWASQPEHLKIWYSLEMHATSCSVESN